MCEDAIIYGGRVSPTVFAAGTGLSERAHQDLTVASYLELRQLWVQYSDAECPFIPVMQARKPRGYDLCRALSAVAHVPAPANPYPLAAHVSAWPARPGGRR